MIVVVLVCFLIQAYLFCHVRNLSKHVLSVSLFSVCL